MNFITAIIVGTSILQVDTIASFISVIPRDFAVIEGQIVLSTTDGLITLQSGESWEPPFNGFLSQIESDGIYLYLLFNDAIRVFKANGKFTGKIIPGSYKGFALSSGSTIFALNTTGNVITRWDYRGRKNIEVVRKETPLKIFAVNNGFALAFPQKTIIYDENGFPVDSINKNTNWIYFNKEVKGYISSDTLWTRYQYVVFDSIISVSGSNDKVYILQSKGLVFRINLRKMHQNKPTGVKIE